MLVFTRLRRNSKSWEDAGVWFTPRTSVKRGLGSCRAPNPSRRFKLVLGVNQCNANVRDLPRLTKRPSPQPSPGVPGEGEMRRVPDQRL